MGAIKKEQLDRGCMAALPAWAIERRRSKSGRELDYVSQYYVIRRLSEIFGATGWSSRTVRLDLRDLRELSTPQGPRWSVVYEATVEVSAGGATKSGSAAGSGLDKDLSAAVHSALTEAETDALKRAARLFGDNLGLALYDKEQRNVDRSALRPSEADRGARPSSSAGLEAAKSLARRLARSAAEEEGGSSLFEEEEGEEEEAAPPSPTRARDVVRAFDHAQRLREITEAIPFAAHAWPTMDEAERALAAASFVRASRRVLGRPPLKSLRAAIEDHEEQSAEPVG